MLTIQMTLPVSPLDRSAPIKVEKEILIADLIDGWRRELGIDIAEELAGMRTVKLCRCTKSRLGFFWPLVAGSPQLYASMQGRPWYYRSGQWEHRFAVGRAGAGGRVLDLGCGAGAFVEMACAAGLRAEGVDFNAAAVSSAQAKGLAISRIAWRELAAERPGVYDLVTAFQLLEHLAEPLPFLQNAVQLTRPGGRLLLAVPDAEGWLGRTTNLLDMPPHHVLRWNRIALSFLTEIFPLDLEELVVEPLDRAHVHGFAGAYIHPNLPIGRRPSFVRRMLCRLAAGILLIPPVRKRLPGQSLIVVFRRRNGFV